MLVAQRVNTAGFVCTDTSMKQVVVTNKIPARINVEPGRACVPYTLRLNAENATGAELVEWTIYDNSTTQKEFKVNGATATHVLQCRRKLFCPAELYIQQPVVQILPLTNLMRIILHELYLNRK